MDMSLVSAFLGAQAGNAQVALAAKFMKENADTAASIANMVEAAARSANSAANAPQGIGANLDISA
ncbi:MAG TPA: hypothetical protein VKX28_03270 [Xanthobacteraceae bacterium]|jgi:hypothetical protein|nr:hypothetical protein [Xanthobacteraceae bacterium]